LNKRELLEDLLQYANAAKRADISYEEHADITKDIEKYEKMLENSSEDVRVLKEKGGVPTVIEYKGERFIKDMQLHNKRLPK
jgi:molybdenum-dependent DNA-binding transcriptional regulator ModE